MLIEKIVIDQDQETFTEEKLLQKPSSRGVLKNLAKFQGKHLRESLCSNKLAGWGSAILLKRDFTQCMWFPKNFG